MTNKFIYKLTSLVEDYISDEDFGPEKLAELAGISHSTLHRKLKSATNQTISQFIREIRLDKARELISNTDKTIAEIAYEVGFGSATYFNKCFHEHFGCSPGEYAKREQENDEKYETTAPSKKNKSLFVYTAILFLIITVSLFFLNKQYHFVNSKHTLEKSVVIAPINYHGNSQYKYQAEGMEEEVQYNLEKIKDLRVLWKRQSN